MNCPVGRGRAVLLLSRALEFRAVVFLWGELPVLSVVGA